MELWIRSQDKRTLVNTRRIDAVGTEIIVGDEGKYSSDVFMGDYKTEERALEVLDEIQELIKPKIINTNYECECKGNPKDKTSFNVEMTPIKTETIELLTYVYEMPEE